MAWPGTWGTAFGTILSGQEQSNQATAAYAQQMQQRQQEEALNHALLVSKLADITKQNAAAAQLSPRYRKMWDAGMSMQDILKAQAQGDAATVAANLYAAKPEDRPKILTEALKNNPDLGAELPEFQKIPGIAPVKAEKENDLDFFKRDPLGYARFKAAGREPAAGTDTETPIPLSDITTVGGKNGYWARSKASPLPKFIEMPGASPKPTKSAAPRKALTPAGLNAVTKQIDNEWALQARDLNPMDVFKSGDRKRAFYASRKKTILFGMGYNESGQPFKDGEQVTDPATGKTLTWRD
jgi:hypothetical protein